MSLLGEFLLYQLASRRYRALAADPAGQERTTSPESYWRWQWDMNRDLIAHYPEFDLRGKMVLDIGCGLGGHTCALARLGPEKIVGVDINAEEIAQARELAAKLPEDLRPRVEFQQVGEDGMPFADGAFDVALCMSSMEHIKDPGAVMQEAHRLLRPGGHFYFETYGWYNHRASHMTGTVPVPFQTVFFSDATILNVARRIMSSSYYVPTQWDSDPPAARWEGISDLRDRPGEYLNKLTVADFRRIFLAVPFSRHVFRATGFSPKRPLLRRLNFLTRVRLVNEMYHRSVIGMGVK